MRVTSLLPALCLLALLLLSAAPAPAGQSLPLLTGEWPPYVSDSLEGGGLAAEVVVHALLAAGLEPSITFAPWTRCESDVRQGRVFAAFPFTPNPDRAEYALFSDPVIQARTVFFYMPERISRFRYIGLDSLRHVTIGGARGYFYAPLFQRAGLRVDYADQAELSFRKLFLGRVDVVPESELVGWEMLRRTYPEDWERFAATTAALSADPMGLMVSRKWPGADELLRRFNQGLQRIRNSGVYGKIEEKYRLKP
ncbi:MAG: substrate-binding periplasmic protein [Desulfovibrionaceae bacterium]